MTMVAPKRLGIVAGGGTLPQTLLHFCDANNIDTFTVGFDGHVAPQTVQNRDHALMRLGEAGSIIRLFRDRGLKDLVIIGSVTRPKLIEMRPDLRTAAFLAKLGLRALGDDGLLKAVRTELEDEGFTIHAIQDIVPDLLAPKGVLGSCQTDDDQWETIRVGFAASRKIGEADIGQSVVACDGDIIGTEDDKGTNALIKRAARPGAVLVKSAKPQQDRKLDMPTLGSDTVKLCADLGYSGIAAEAGGVILADREAMIRIADARGLFLVGA